MKKVIKSIFTAVLAFGLTSCGSDYFDINQDPDVPSDSYPNLTLPPAMSATAFVTGGNYQILGGIWSQHWTQAPEARQYQSIEEYQITTQDFNREWRELYAAALQDYAWVAEKSEETGQLEYYLISKVMQAYTFQVLTDFYGDVPFSEALKGSSGTDWPKFDKSTDIYDGLIPLIDDAVAKYKDGVSKGGKPSKDDIVFGGNMDNWLRFANTLKLKIYMRQIHARPDVAKAGISKLFADGAQFLASDAEITHFIDQAKKRNPVYEREISAAGHGNVNLVASATVVNELLANSDPRIDFFFTKSKNEGVHIGLEQGDFERKGLKRDGFSRVNLKPTSPVVFISAAESAFLQAEAAIRFPDVVSGVTAKGAYEAGVKASFADCGFAASADGFLAADGAYAYPESGTDEEKIEAVVTQKWLAATNSRGAESHFDFLRTGYPKAFTVSKISVIGDQFPQRLPYPDNEIQANPNTPPVKLVTDKIWWAK
ncbi:hypothetical protein FUAX_27810 [Fulvitalea axinellae]|uniref:SusD/RagB family nutrient-binding outer membrane lipoprotein n=1 Tax=Fulvitalea axinellae TaxID=1182444 RepID=A0AAU9CDX4_9BACT|nr:hypothetical protein FUAX_27810 [Fulvitalea axinellae]